MSNTVRRQGSWDKKGSKEESNKVLLSFESLDIRQGQTLRTWGNEANLLLKLVEIGASLNKLTYSQSITENIIEEYDITDRTKFSQNNMPLGSVWTYPTHLKDKNVKWCKIRLGSTRRVIGFMRDHVFYVVFLDKDHQFYPTEPSNT